MKFNSKNIYLLSIFIVAVIISTLSWESITLQSTKNFDCCCCYSEYFFQKYNPLNDSLRFIFFVGFPLLSFIFCIKYFYPESTYKLKEVLQTDICKRISNNYNQNLDILFYIFLFIIILEFFLLEFQNLSQPSLDIFHEGLWLTSSNNYSLTQKFWNSSYLGRGLFGNFRPVIFWELFNNNTIGSVRFADKLLLLLSKICLLVLAKQVTSNLNYKKVQKIVFFFFLSILFVSLVEYLDRGEFQGRSLLLIFFFNLFFFSLSKKNSFVFSNLLIGFFSIISLLWYIDIGAYLNLLIIFILIFFTIRKEFKTVSSILFGIILGWLLFYLFIPESEFLGFISNTMSIYTTIDIIHGLIYPTPFFSGDARATRTLIFFVLAGAFVISMALIKKSKFSNLNKIFFIFLFLGSLIFFKTALSNSDNGHIKIASGPVLTIIYTAFLYLIFEFFKNINIKNRKYFINEKLYIFCGAIFFSIIVLNANILKIKNIITAPERINKLITYKDDVYISSEYKNLINYYDNLALEDNCVQILTDEVALPFLLKKKTCTKFYLMFIGSPKKLQKKLIEELTLSKPNIILIKTEVLKYSVPPDRLKLVFNFINNNYSFHSKYKYWTFVKLN